MSQPLAGTLLGSRKLFHRRMGPPGSQCRDVEPMTTVLTAGSTEQSTPHHCRVTHYGLKEIQAEMLTLRKKSGANATFGNSTAHQSEALCSF